MVGSIKDPSSAPAPLLPELTARRTGAALEPHGGGAGTVGAAALAQAVRVTLPGAETVVPLSLLLSLLDRVQGIADLPPQLAEQLASLRTQLLHPTLPAPELLTRLVTFVTAYAERFAELGGDAANPEAKAAFAEVFRTAGFDALRELTTGLPAPAFFLQLLSAADPAALRERARHARWEVAPHPGGIDAALEEAARRHARETVPWAARFVRGQLGITSPLNDAQLNLVVWTALGLLGMAALVAVWLHHVGR